MSTKSTSTVLYDAPGPKARVRNNIIAVVFIVVLVALFAWVITAFAANGQFDQEKLEPFADANYWGTYILPGLWGTFKAALASIILAMIMGAFLGIGRLSVSVSLLLIWVTNAGTTKGGDWGDVANNNDWWSLTTVLMVGGALIAAILFVIVELRSKEPLIPLTLFRNSTFTLSVIASIATGIAMFGASVFLSQYMQLARGATPTVASPTRAAWPTTCCSAT